MSLRIVTILTLLPPKPSRPTKLAAKGLVPIIALPVGLGASVLGALILAGSAGAADVPARAPAGMPAKAPAAPAYNWTGCYVGANTGAAAAGSDFTSTVSPGTHLVNAADLAAVAAAGTGSANDSRFIGGGQLGCNWQTGTLVFGVEGDLDSFSTRSTSTVNGTLTTTDAFTITNAVKTNWLGTVRPRVGVAADRSLAYVTGGVAFTNFSYAQTYADTLSAAAGGSSASSNATGWTVGGGWETAWEHNWIFRAEYLFAKFRSIGASGAILDTARGSNALRGSADLTVQVLRAGMNYKF
jgi:outer membrane immunogenic protein